MVSLKLTEAELAHLVITLEGCRAEFEELMMTKEWFVTELTDRIDTALEILTTAEQK